MTTSAKTIGAAASSLILLSSAALAAAPAVMDITADASPAAATRQATEASAAAEATGVQRVEGQFSYDQGVVTSNETIASVFAKAAATLCQATADGYGVYTAQAIKVSVAACRPWRPPWPRWPRRRRRFLRGSAAPAPRTPLVAVPSPMPRCRACPWPRLWPWPPLKARKAKLVFCGCDLAPPLPARSHPRFRKPLPRAPAFRRGRFHVKETLPRITCSRFLPPVSKARKGEVPSISFVFRPGYACQAHCCGLSATIARDNE